MAGPENDTKSLRGATRETLASTLVALGAEELLDVPLSAARAFGLRWPEPLLTLSIRFLDASITLRALLLDDMWWKEVAKRRVVPAVPTAHLVEWLEEVRAEKLVADEIPRGRRAIQAWAQARGVSELLQLELDGAIAMAHGEGSDRPRLRAQPGATLLDLLAEATDEPSIEELMRSRATRAFAWARLVLEVRDRQRGLAEEAQLVLKAPEAPRAKELFELLGEVRAELRADAAPRSRDRTRRGVLGGPHRLAAGAIHISYVDGDRLWEQGRLRAPEVTLVLRALEPGGLDVSCTCARERCTHALAAVDDLRMTLSGVPWGYARSVIALLDEVARPLSVRVDRAIEQLVSRASLGDEEVAFGWIVIEDHGLHLVAAIQRRGKRGYWLQPRRATTADLAALPRQLLTPIDAVLLDTTVMPKSHATAVVLGGAEALRALERLIGHPRVWLEGAWESALEVRRAELEVSLGARPDGNIGLGVALDGEPRERAALLSLLGELLEGRTAWLDRGRLSVLAIDPDTEMLLQLAVATAHSLPPDVRPRIESALGALMSRLPLALGEGFRGPAVPCNTYSTVRLTALDTGGLHVAVSVRPVRGGVLQVPGDGPDIVIGRGESGPVHTVRDRPRERERADWLCHHLGLSGWSQAGERVDAIERALELVEKLRAEPEVEVEWASARQMRVRGPAQKVSIELGVTDARDWFGVEGKVQLDDAQLELAALIEALRRGHSYVRVGEDEWVRIDEALRSKLQALADAASIERGQVTVPRVSARALLPVLEEAHVDERSPALVAVLERMAAAEALDLDERDPPVTAEMRTYQREGWAWLTRLAEWGAGACLADDMGLGKTLQALAVLADRADRGPQVVVAPTSVVGNWRRETAKFAPGLRAIVYREGDRRELLGKLGPGDLLLLSYGILVRDVEALSSVSWATLVLDEAQAVKNADTQRARAVRALEADWRLALTGTPMENHLGELWSLFDVLSPGLLGRERDFRDRFILPIERGKDAERRAALSRLVRPYILRRTKGEVARDLPPRTELTLEIELSNAESKLYEDARQAAIARIAGLSRDEQSRFQVLAEIMRLRQLACHPRMVYPDEVASSSKLETALALIEQLRAEGHRALVFSQFTRHLAFLRAALDDAKVPYHYLDGSTPALEREKRVESFQAGDGDLFLISLKAGGVGLNLTGADYVLHLDPWWNPAVEDQATDRAHRIGQTRPVTVYRLVSKGTIEEQILALHAEKRALVASVLDGTDVAASLSTEDLVALIGEGARLNGAAKAPPPTRLGARVRAEAAVPNSGPAVAFTPEAAPPPAGKGAASRGKKGRALEPPPAPGPVQVPPVSVSPSDKKRRIQLEEIVLPPALGHDPGGLAILVEAYAEAEGEDPVMQWLQRVLCGDIARALTTDSTYDDVVRALRDGPLTDASAPDGRTARARLKRLWAFGEEVMAATDE